MSSDHTCTECGHGFDVDGDSDVCCPKCGQRLTGGVTAAAVNTDDVETTQAIRNALEDLETSADRVKSDFDAEAIRQSVATIREELGDG